VTALQEGLSRFGYDCPVTGLYDEDTRAVVVAFQRHFRPERLDGLFDPECRARLLRLNQMI
jgi:N-acetylmuramoyl-L-alanine amidase